MDNDYDIEEKEDENLRRPSIPSIVPKMNHSNHSQSSDCSLSSLVSELTLMTFSEEKAAMLKSEFLSRVQQDSHTRSLSKKEKMTLLMEIQTDQERKIKVEMQRQEKKRSMDRKGERTRHEFFERLNALRVDMEAIREIDLSPDRAGEGGVGQDGGVISDLGAQHEVKPRGSGLNRRRSLLSKSSLSDTTDKRDNSTRTLLLSNSCGHEGEHMASVNSDSESKSSISTTNTSGTSRAHIQTIIKLKMEMANQQATIDTIAAQLHNREIDISNLLSALSLEKSARKAAERAREVADKENQELTEQLRQKEVELQLEAMTSRSSTPSLPRPEMVKQSSTVDWGASDRSSSIKVEKEEDLSKEKNARLPQGRRGSINTEVTEHSTSLDSSSGHEVSQPQPRSRARPEDRLGASLRSLGLKLPFTKMRRSRSDMREYANNYFEEELVRERAPSTSLDDIKDDSRGFATASSDAAGIDNGLQNFQRRWSTGDRGQKKKTILEDDNEEGRGIGGWLNGWNVFGKVDEVDDDEGASADMMI